MSPACRPQRPRSALPATVAALVLLCGCAPEPQPSGPPAPASAAIPHPSLEAMEPAVAEALRAQRAEVDALLGRPDAAAAERAQAIGRLGQLYQAHRLVEAAEACYREAHALDPGHFDWAYLLGVLAARRANLDEAVAAFREAVELRPGDLPAMIRLADLELDRGELDAAHALYARAQSRDPSLAAAEYGLGQVAAGRGHYPEAIEHFSRALDLQPRASVVRYHLGQAYRQLGRLEEAESQLAESGPVKVALPDPLMSEVNALAAGAAPYLIQGNTALRDGRLSVAARAYRLAVEADPEDPRARQGLAAVLTLVRDLEGATEQLAAAARLAPDNARAQGDLGAVLAERGLDEQALPHLERAVELEPALQEARFNLASALARLGRLGEAVEHYRQLLEIDPSHVEARSRLGTVLAQAGRVDQAVPELREAVRQNPEDAAARLNLGLALAQTGDLAGALAEHREVLELATDDATLARAHLNLGTFHLRRSDPGQALEHMQRALAHDDRLVPAHLAVANLLAASDRLVEALPHFARVRELQPAHRTARLAEATALMLLGRFPEARTVLEESLRLVPEEDAAAHALARLLAGAPDPALRDGRRSLDLISRLLEDATPPSYVETRAMALAELGRFEEAADWQRAVLAEARSRGRSAAAERLERNLARYQRGLACCAEPRDALPAGHEAG